MPKSINESIEIKMEDLKGEIKEIMSEVKAVIGTADNLTSEQQRSIKSLVKRAIDNNCHNPDRQIWSFFG